jgi:coproporphyrinogen III oxidase
MDAPAVKRYLNDLHDRITAAVEAIDGAKFRRDRKAAAARAAC